MVKVTGAVTVLVDRMGMPNVPVRNDGHWIAVRGKGPRCSRMRVPVESGSRAKSRSLRRASARRDHLIGKRSRASMESGSRMA